jgi:putative ABC transport system substrate-binding protein
MPSRRRFLVVAACGAMGSWAPVGRPKQEPRRAYRIGVLETTPLALNSANIDALRQGLRDLGYVEGGNLTIDYRSADGRADRFPRLVEELIRSKSDVIVVRGVPAALAAKKASVTIPIVMTATADPVRPGIVSSLASPGGNITGLTTLVPELTAKRLQVLKELVPDVARVGNLTNTSNPAAPLSWKEAELASAWLGVRAVLLDVRDAAGLPRAFEAAARQGIDALLVTLDGVLVANRHAIAALAARHRLPAMYASREFVDAGGLISYGVHYPHLYFRAAAFVDKILKGADPSQLPLEQPTRFELVINRGAAKLLNLTIPEPLLLRTDDVVE